MHSIDLTTIAVGPTEFGHWAALNAPLGLDAFGVNVVEPAPESLGDIAHDEADSSQQELFVVISGRARFTIGDEVLEAGPGYGDRRRRPGGHARLRGARARHARALHRRAAPAGPDWGYWITSTGA